ncbi:MAG TPA: hypothetical protein VMR18_02085 [Candidatus Saccharimonadales bacterium]|jgi:drug/metabolite transporter (DMT)-like permease|nr:hypothetical protein [Candidatus Saccharimonadales bacterium]
MRSSFIYISAAFACAACNGIAAVLQKISADKEKNVSSLDMRLLWRLFQKKPYILGVVLDLLGWLFTIFAVQHLPIFLVQAIIASNIVITILVERLFRHKVIKTKSYVAIATILAGLILLGMASSPEKIAPVVSALKWLIVLTPIPVGVAGYVLVRYKSYISTIGLAILGGLAFGGTSIVGRVFRFSQPTWHTIYSPLFFALIASGILGMLLFSIALQRAQAAIINASTTASQTLVPALIGIAFLGDRARNGMWYLVFLGTFLALGGVVFLALGNKNSS